MVVAVVMTLDGSQSALWWFKCSAVPARVLQDVNQPPDSSAAKDVCCMGEVVCCIISRVRHVFQLVLFDKALLAM